MLLTNFTKMMWENFQNVLTIRKRLLLGILGLYWPSPMFAQSPAPKNVINWMAVHYIKGPLYYVHNEPVYNYYAASSSYIWTSLCATKNHECIFSFIKQTSLQFHLQLLNSGV